MAQEQAGGSRSGIWAVVVLLVVGLLFFVTSGRTKRGDDEATGEGEPTVIIVHPDGNREEMPMEEYIQGVVAGEMGRLPARGSEDEEDWPVEAYAALAILARSFTMQYLEERGGNEIAAEHQTAQAYNPDNIMDAITEGV